MALVALSLRIIEIQRRQLMTDLDPEQAVTNADDNTNTTTSIPIIFYSKSRTDRSGSTIQDMLLAHAYAFQQNAIYGGACALSVPDIQSNTTEPRLKRYVAPSRLIQSLGLQHIIGFRCPTRNLFETAEPVFLGSEKYKSVPTASLWTPAWIDYIRENMKNPQQRSSQPGERPHNATTVAIHIRRGDVTPCTIKGRNGHHLRYLPFQHYWNIMEAYVLPAQVHVEVYSETQSFEPWTDFDSLFNNFSYSLHLDVDLAETWTAMRTADVLIMSKSSFSFTPALFSTGTVLYTPFWHTPLDHWTVVNETILNSTHAAMELLRRQAQCQK